MAISVDGKGYLRPVQIALRMSGPERIVCVLRTGRAAQIATRCWMTAFGESDVHS